MRKILVGILFLLLIAGYSYADGDDLIVLQDGSHRTGTLQGCLNGNCQLSGRTIPQATIIWIGLHQAGSNPPQPNDAAVAEIVMTDHSVHPGLMTAIDPTRVMWVAGTYDRQKVAWVYLTHPAKGAREAPTTGSRTVRFDVHVAVTIHLHIQEHNASLAAAPSVEDSSYDWTGSWQNVTFRIVPGRTVGKTEIPPGIFPELPYPTGVVQASAKFTFNDPPNRYKATNCKGEVPAQTYTGTFVLNYPRQARAGEQFVIAQAQNTGAQFLAAIKAAIESSCAPEPLNVAGYPPGYLYFHFGAPDGIGYDPLYLALDLDWDRASSSAPDMPFPLDQILTGKSITLETGTQSRFYASGGGGAGPGDGKTVDETVRVSFTPH